MSKNTEGKPIATLTIKGACDLRQTTRKALVDWLREQAQALEFQSHELAKVYSARFWRTK